MSLQEQQQLEARYVLPTYGRKPVEFVRGEGMRLYDDEGHEYLDFLAGIGAVSVGHANPRVTAAIQEQAARLLHVGNYYYVEGRGELAERLSRLLNDSGAPVATESPVDAADNNPADPVATGNPADPVATDSLADAVSSTNPGADWRTFFANSGAEAIEGAIKLARRYGSRHLDGASTIVTAERSFHGRTLAALASTGQPSKQEAFQPLPAGFVHVPFNDLDALRATLDRLTHAEVLLISPGQTATISGDDVSLEGVPAHAESEIPPPSSAVCAVLLEVVQGEGGVWPVRDEYLRAVRALTAERGILLIIDEIQTGFYRTGRPFAFQHSGVRPDIVTLAKGIANGVPMGAIAACGLAAEGFEPGDHGSTFGGSPLAIAAANATLDELAAIAPTGCIQQVGDHLAVRLAALPLVTEVRGRGLMRAVSLSKPVATQVVDAALSHGLVLNAIGDSILRFLPPLICTIADVDELIERLSLILASVPLASAQAGRP